MKCRLCEDEDIQFYTKDKKRAYYICNNCDVVFVNDEDLPSVEFEKTKYDQHNNSVEHQGYKDFLGLLKNPLCELLEPNSFGLDFGSGPGPTLNILFEEEGYRVNLYDFFYAQNDNLNPKVFQYDFITSTEVFEHLHNPIQDISKLLKCLKRNGYLAIMTGLRDDKNKDEFDKWWYKNDHTHIIFYSSKSMQYIADKFDLNIVYQKKNVIIFKKRN
jgi:SAM-dependent methyltransferase